MNKKYAFVDPAFATGENSRRFALAIYEFRDDNLLLVSEHIPKDINDCHNYLQSVNSVFSGGMYSEMFAEHGIYIHSVDTTKDKLNIRKLRLERLLKTNRFLCLANVNRSFGEDSRDSGFWWCRNAAAEVYESDSEIARRASN